MQVPRHTNEDAVGHTTKETINPNSSQRLTSIANIEQK